MASLLTYRPSGGRPTRTPDADGDVLFVARVNQRAGQCFGVDFVAKFGGELRNRHGPDFSAGAMANSNGSGRGFTLAQNGHVGNLRQRRSADLGADLLRDSSV